MVLAERLGTRIVHFPATMWGYHLSRMRFKISMSLDGFVAGPSQSVDNPLGIGGMRLHEWVFPLTVWRAMLGRTTVRRGRGRRSNTC